MICAFCKEAIEDNSVYCDQCGQEVKQCPNCGKTGKGKICTTCGTPIAPKKNESAVNHSHNLNSGSDVLSPQNSDSNCTIRLITDLNIPVVPELTLLNKTIKHEIKIENDFIIGRTTGQYSLLFSSFPQVSGTHCKFVCDPEKGWFVTDLGSSNGTMVNNQSIAPNAPQPLYDKSYLKIANIEYYVKITS